MIDIQELRKRPEAYQESITKRGKHDLLPLIEQALDLDAQWRANKGELDTLRAKRNSLSKAINAAKKKGEDATEIITEAKALPQTISDKEIEVAKLREKLDNILKTLPNLLDPKVPEGSSEAENTVRETHGEKTEFDFEPKNHVELAENLGIADFESARKTSGSGFFFLKGDLALLDLALQRYALDTMLEAGFTPIIPPYMIRREIVDGVVDLETFEELIYKIEDEDLYPIATSEHSLIGLYVNTEISTTQLPITLCAISPCFRKEVGAHGIDEKGVYRTHQFTKVEQIVLCTPQTSAEWYDKLLALTKKIFTGLELPWQELEMCTGDLGALKSRQADLEVYSPRREDYFEVSSCSNLTDAQARRLNIRMVHPDGTREHLHTLNNTALATSRAMVAILENFQTKEGTIRIPQVLQKYMQGKEVITQH